MSDTRPLPPNWSNATLDDVIACLESGSRPRGGVSRIVTGVPSLGGEHLGVRGGFRFDKMRFVPEEFASRQTKGWIKSGDILVVKDGATTGKVSFVGTDFPYTKALLNEHVFRCAIARPIDARFIFYWLYSAEGNRRILLDFRGAAQGGISRGFVTRVALPVPPASEQPRIVEAIDSYLTRLDEAIASLDRVQIKLKAYRASVLKAAVEGRLVPVEASLAREEKRDYESADALLGRILKERRRRWEEAELAKLMAAGKTPKDDRWKAKYEDPVGPETSKLPQLPVGWCWATLDQLSIVVRGASPRPAGDPRYFGGKVPWITVGSLTADEEPYLRYVSESLTEAGRKASRFVEAGTLLLTNSGATLGVPKITLIGGCINDGSVALLHVNDTTKLYLYFFLKTLTQNLRSINQGAAQPNLNTGIVRNISVAVPPITEQSKITTELERLLSVTTAIEAEVFGGRRRGLRLRQAVLKWAFEGKLVDQDRDDESAERLLVRIRAERAAGTPTKKRRRRTAKGAA